MDYHNLILPAALAVYMAFEYQRREQAHRKRLELLKRDIEPPEAPGGSVLARIITYGLTGLLLLFMIYLFTRMGLEMRAHSAAFLLWPAAFFILLVFVILIVVRDIRTYQTDHRS